MLLKVIFSVIPDVSSWGCLTSTPFWGDMMPCGVVIPLWRGFGSTWKCHQVCMVSPRKGHLCDGEGKSKGNALLGIPATLQPLPFLGTSHGMRETSWQRELGSGFLGGKCSLRARNSSALSQAGLSFPRICSFPSFFAVLAPNEPRQALALQANAYLETRGLYPLQLLSLECRSA